MLLKCEGYTNWELIATKLNLSKQIVENISHSINGLEKRDKRGFLLVLTRWLQYAPKTNDKKKAVWRNLRTALSEFDFAEEINLIEQRYYMNKY